MSEIPDFKTLEEEVEFWETHDSADYWGDMEEAEFETDLHQNLLHPRMITLIRRPERCPRCGNDLDDAVVEHVAWNCGHLLMIRDVPALRCQRTGHEYILEKTLDRLEHLLHIENTEKPQPAEIIRMPVFSLNMAV